MPPGAVRVTDGEADLIWDARSGEASGPLGDLISGRITPALLPAVVQRQRVVTGLQAMVARHALEVRVERITPPRGTRGLGRGTTANNAAHPIGTPLRVIAEGILHPNFVMFNLAGDGTVQNLYPGTGERPTAPPGGSFRIDDVEAKPPPGADHLVAIASASPLGQAAEALAQLDGRREPIAALNAVLRALPAEAWQVGLVGLYTRD